MSTNPLGVFTLSRPHGTVRAHGVRTRFTDAHAAARALRAGEITALTGALPFDLSDPAALVEPQTLNRANEPVTGSGPADLEVIEREEIPDAQTHRRRVRDALGMIRSGHVDKVVLARALELRLGSPADPHELFLALAQANSDGSAFAVDVSAGAGASADSPAWLVGASPEMLVARSGMEVTCLPFAGSAPRSADPRADQAAAQRLTASAKDHAEHAFVVDFIRERLSPLCEEVRAPRHPEVRSTSTVWHLSTPIRARLSDPDTTALDLALALTPTPAVCGVPDAVAAQIISDIEGARGFYGGAVGWCDAGGDGEWMVTIRCLQLNGDGLGMRTWAGGGIVAGSDPQEEYEETTAKLQTVGRALGLGL